MPSISQALGTVIRMDRCARAKGEKGMSSICPQQFRQQELYLSISVVRGPANAGRQFKKSGGTR